MIEESHFVRIAAFLSTHLVYGIKICFDSSLKRTLSHGKFEGGQSYIGDFGRVRILESLCCR